VLHQVWTPKLVSALPLDRVELPNDIEQVIEDGKTKMGYRQDVSLGGLKSREYDVRR
jgi:hypothetical protein